MYFLVLDLGDARERAREFVESHKGEMARSSTVRFSVDEIRNFDLTPSEASGNVYMSGYGMGMLRYMTVLHLSFGVSQKKQYGDIETMLRLMFGKRFLGRSRTRRDD